MIRWRRLLFVLMLPVAFFGVTYLSGPSAEQRTAGLRLIGFVVVVLMLLVMTHNEEHS